MTLKEKFITAIAHYYNNEELANVSKQIADDFAKEVLRVYITNKTLQYKQSQGDYSLDELLLIIKKEKGL